MKIAMVSEHASPLATLGGVDAGGQNVYVAALAAELGRWGHEVVVHTRRDDPDLPRRVRFAPGVEVHHVRAGPPEDIPKDLLFPYMDDFADELAAEWARSRPQVAHGHFWMSGYAALAAGRALGLPVVHTFHALGVVKRRHQGAKDTSPAERLDVERDLIRGMDEIVATCSDELFELVRLGADARRVTVVPAGVDLARFSPHGTEFRRGARPRIVVVSRLVERKGIANVISSLVALPDAELVVAGGPPADAMEDDPEARRYLRLAEDLGVADRVSLLGSVHQEDVPALFRSADLVVCAPWYEPFGMAAVEAMACGVPVVASAVGGLIDTVLDGVTGVHVPPRDTEALTAAMRALLDDAPRREEMGAAGARRARARYGWDRVARSITDVYGRCMAEAAVRAHGVRR